MLNHTEYLKDKKGVHPFFRPQRADLFIKKIPTKVPAKYADIVGVFSLDLASKLPKHTKLNNHVIKLVDGLQAPFNRVIRQFKALVSTSDIIYLQESHNNLTIKNQFAC